MCGFAVPEGRDPCRVLRDCLAILALHRQHLWAAFLVEAIPRLIRFHAVVCRDAGPQPDRSLQHESAIADGAMCGPAAPSRLFTSRRPAPFGRAAGVDHRRQYRQRSSHFCTVFHSFIWVPIPVVAIPSLARRRTRRTDHGEVTIHGKSRRRRREPSICFHMAWLCLEPRDRALGCSSSRLQLRAFCRTPPEPGGAPLRSLR